LRGDVTRRRWACFERGEEIVHVTGYTVPMIRAVLRSS
jgi:hypothetical protein